jgi:hypothetical protein
MDASEIIAYCTAVASGITAVGGSIVALWLKAKQAATVRYLNAVDGRQESAINDLRKAMNGICPPENKTCVMREIPPAQPGPA